MRAVILMFDSLNRHMLNPYGDTVVDAPNFARLAAHALTFDNFYAGSMPCMPARREMHTGRYNFLHRSWGPLEPYDDSMPEILGSHGVHTHLTSDHPHYWEDGGATYHARYTTWEFHRGQEGDPWKGDVAALRDLSTGGSQMRRQDVVNRKFMGTEAEHSQTRTVDSGLEFIDRNAGVDRWLLQIELFDPHEPFFASEPYRDLYPALREDQGNDWPDYLKVTEAASEVDLMRARYAALVSQCDRSLGRVLDAFDRHGLWDDTMLIVNTDHGFLLGERGWWAKSVQPWFNELVHLPMFLWDPRTGVRGDRRISLAQTVDIAPTVLAYFGLDVPEGMDGRDLAPVITGDDAVRRGGLFGIHGGHVNVTDGRYVYMRSCHDVTNQPLEEFTLMPTHMRARFAPDELRHWEPAPPFEFTKGVATMRIPSRALWMNPWPHGTQLYDLVDDPQQKRPIVDHDVELRMAQLLVDLMRDNDAPTSQYERLGLPAEGPVTTDHLRAAADLERTERSLQPLDAEMEQHATLLDRTLEDLLGDDIMQPALQRYLPGIGQVEMVNVSADSTLRDLVRVGVLPRACFDDLVAANLDPAGSAR